MRYHKHYLEQRKFYCNSFAIEVMMKKILFYVLCLFSVSIFADLKKLEAMAIEGDAKAQYNLGVIYAYGVGTKKDYQEAKKYFDLSANQGFSDAQFKLGSMYYVGEGVIQDYYKAKKYFELASSQGDSDAQFLLGVIYHKGYGIKQDYQKAKEFYNLSCNNGIPEACVSYSEFNK